MSIELIPYQDEYADTWDVFCASGSNSTFLQTRRFLSYHGERFKDESLLVVDNAKLVGLLPAAASQSGSKLVVSHPGTTYGGLIHSGKLGGARMIEAWQAISSHYRKVGYGRLLYKTVPFIYATVPAQDDLYALSRLNAQRVRCDLSCCIDLAAQRPISERRRRGLKKAQKTVTLSSEAHYLPDVWRVVEQNLARKHGAIPVHTLEEIDVLRCRFPHNILVYSAAIDGVVEAGVVLFNSANVWHAQYIAASERAYDVSALDAIFDNAINDARLSGARYFDFGTSNEDGGKVLNDGLYKFKSEFGGGGCAYETYEIALEIAP
jgi:hypothetical protein